jgi:hypothetical protein
MRAKTERTIKVLWMPSVPSSSFTPAECANFFKAAGHDPD